MYMLLETTEVNFRLAIFNTGKFCQKKNLCTSCHSVRWSLGCHPFRRIAVWWELWHTHKAS